MGNDKWPSYTPKRTHIGTSSVSRQGLRPYKNRRMVFSATVGRDSIAYMPSQQKDIRTRLLTGVKDEYGELVAEHVWVKADNEPLWVKEGLIISFSAVVLPYVRQRAGRDIVEMGLEDVRDLCLYEGQDDDL